MATLGSPAVLAALRLAREVHAEQRDKVGEPYFAHPLRVALSMAGDAERQVGALHDVIEDSPLTCEDLLARGFAEDVVRAVDALTKRPGEPLEESMARAAADPLARAVKLADLADNASPARQVRLSDADRARLGEKYRRSAELLGTDLATVLARVPADPAVPFSRELPSWLEGTGLDSVPPEPDMLVNVAGPSGGWSVTDDEDGFGILRSDDLATQRVATVGELVDAYRLLWVLVRPAAVAPDNVPALWARHTG